MKRSPEPSTTRRFWKRLPSFVRSLVTLGVFAVVMLTGRASVADHYRVPTGSMRPTVKIGDRVMVDKSAYGIRVPLTNHYLREWAGPRRGDVVVLDPPDGGPTVLLKRVVAVPGDHVMVRAGLVWLNGVPAKITHDDHGPREVLNGRSHAIRLTGPAGPDFGPTIIPPRRYLLLGDNRGDSHDSRYFGLIPRHKILGKATHVYHRQGHFIWEKL
jgi:signal peptidase I